jgi:hypothetical protein
LLAIGKTTYEFITEKRRRRARKNKTEVFYDEDVIPSRDELTDPGNSLEMSRRI